MRDPFRNPFGDDDRRAIWTMLVERDIDAFLRADWSMVEADFVPAGFFGIDAGRHGDPDRWRLSFPSLDRYRDEWLAQARSFAELDFAEEPRGAIFRTTTLDAIEVADEAAIAHKKFDGGIRKADGSFERMLWQTLYHCRRDGGRWRICAFTGYLPNPMGSN